MKKILVAIATIAAMITPAAPPPVTVSAAEPMSVVFEDVTASDATTIEGETKIKVSVDGVEGDASIVQLFLDFTGDFKYKSIEYLYENDSVTKVSPNAAAANIDKEINFSLVSANPDISLSGKTDICVLTFSGATGDSMTLSMDDVDMTYTMLGKLSGGEEIHPDAPASITAQGSSSTNKGIDGVVRIIMDKVTDFRAAASGSYVSSGIEFRIIDESNPNNVYYTGVNNIPISSGGHRDTGKSTPTFEISTILLDGHSYTVEISGIGYTLYKREGVNFGDGPLEVTNSEMQPGDVDGDGKVDRTDYDKLKETIEQGGKNDTCDFNRDGIVDDKDMAILTSVYTPSGTDTPTPTTAPTATPGSTGGNGGGGGGGGGAAGTPTQKPSASPAPSNTQNPSATAKPGVTEVPDNTDKPFTDLGSHAWAESSIYKLYNKGIITGTSDTTYSPANNIKRGDFMLILTRMFGIDDEFTDNFADVPAGSYYYNAIGSAKAAGIAAGYGDSFMPEDFITRQDLITLAYRTFVKAGYLEEDPGDSSALDQFADKGAIADYAVPAMTAMVSAGIISGDGANVNPLNNATRAEAAVMCARMVDMME